MINIDANMPRGTQRRFFLKRCGLLVFSLLFLGSAGISAYKTTGDSSLAFHNDDLSGNVTVTDQIFAEDGEERDGETGSDAYVADLFVHPPEIDFLRQGLSVRVTLSKSFFVYLPSNPRAPPAL
jgi:hypothetical protein